MRLTILSIAYPFATVEKDSVGGAEQILSLLDHALVSAEHHSIVIARQDSRTEGELFETAVPAGVIDEHAKRWVYKRHQENIDRVLRTHRVDLVHFHGIDFHQYRLHSRVPALATLHLPPSWYPNEIWNRQAHSVHLQCVSRNQRKDCPPEAGNLPVLENGVPIYPKSAHSKRRFALALGRICPVKNLHVALDAGKLAGVPVLLGGQTFPYPEHLQYFQEKIRPRLDTQRRFLGPLRNERKLRFLRAAKCLLLPTLAPETSSLVAMEALAAGTPVIAFASGAIPEIIEHGVTGYLVKDAEEMAAAIPLAEKIDPEICRQTAIRRFSQQRMVDQYFSLYRDILLSRIAGGAHNNAAAKLG
jgi:glycosyltransferase involved in cell wall biosynthesis